MDGWYYFFLGAFVSSIAFLILLEKRDNARGTGIPMQPTVPKMPKRIYKNKVKRKNFRKETSKSKKKKKKKKSCWSKYK